MTEWNQVASGDAGLRIYRVDAHSGSFSGSSGRSVPNPLELILGRYPSPTARYLTERFSGDGAAVGSSSFSVACHVISLPEALIVVDSTYRTTAGKVFPAALEAIIRAEGRRPGDRPISVIYTHAHFDHSGGHLAVEDLDGDVEILAHAYTAQLFPLLSRRESFLKTKAGFLRDCEIEIDLDGLSDQIRAHYMRAAESSELDLDRSPFGSVEDGPLRVDRTLEPGLDSVDLAGGRVQVLRFDGHIPGHLCVLVDRGHLISGDMWLPATTSLVTPGLTVEQAGVPAEHCGVLEYMASGTRLLDMPVDHCVSYPSHEIIFRNPKRMAMRDLELLAERVPMVYAVLRDHQREPMRVLDLAWGGPDHEPIWKVETSMFRLVVAHEEAASWVQDLVACEDLREVEPERYTWTGRTALGERVRETLRLAREQHGALEFRSRGRA